MIVIRPRGFKPIQVDRDNEDFRTLAIRIHGNQKYGDSHYGMHLAMVENTLVNHNYRSYEYRAAAWLHDIVEDTETSYEDIWKLYGEDITCMVWGCTGEGKNRKERNSSIYAKLKEYPRAAPVKVADRYSNLSFGIISRSDKLGMYVREFAEFSDNVRPLILDTKNGAMLWNKLEGLVVQASEIVKQKMLATEIKIS